MTKSAFMDADKYKESRKAVIGDDFFVTIIMNDGSVLHKAKVGFLDKHGMFDFIPNIESLKNIINSQENNAKLLAFSTNHVQGYLIKESIRSISILT